MSCLKIGDKVISNMGPWYRGVIIDIIDNVLVVEWEDREGLYYYRKEWGNIESL